MQERTIVHVFKENRLISYLIFVSHLGEKERERDFDTIILWQKAL